MRKTETDIAAHRRYYIASGLENHDAVSELAKRLHDSLHVHLTYDWTPIAPSTIKVGSNQIGDPERGMVAEREIQGVIDALFIVFVPPGGRGMHVELGAALALHKPVFALIPEAGVESLGTKTENGVHYCVFYSHPRFFWCKDQDELRARIRLFLALHGVET